jgi:hypothetical protein
LKKSVSIDIPVEIPLKKIIKKLGKKTEENKETKETGKRPDRKKKLLDRKDKQETVVKCCLNKFLSKAGDHKINLLDEIRKRIDAYSKREFIMSISLNLLLKELFDNEDILQVEIPDIFDTTFIRQLTLGTEQAQNTNTVVQKFYQEHHN